MLAKQIFEDVSEKVHQAFENSPVKDVEKNVKAIVTSAFSRMDLVTREDYEVQQSMLLRACEELSILQQKVAQLESQLASNSTEE